MGSKRRYKIGKYPAYDNTFNIMRLESQLLNEGSHKVGLNTVFADKYGLIMMKLSIEGDNEGNVYRNGEKKLAAIPFEQQRLRKLQRQFRSYQRQRVQIGHEKPQEYPVEMLTEKVQVEARLDVLKEELELVEKKLARYTEEEEKQRLNMILKSGPIGTAKCSRENGGALSMIDGQRVSIINKILVIDEPVSPYHGMSVADYRKHVSDPYRITKQLLQTEKSTLYKKLAMQGIMDEDIRTEKWTERRKELFNEHEDWAQLFHLHVSGKPSMPIRPVDHRKYL